MLILHDLEIAYEQELSRVFSPEALFSARQITQCCIGCFGCWVKTPGLCTIGGSQNVLLHKLAKCRHFVVVSRCVYGGLSPALKLAYDRCIGYLLPFFYVHQAHDETHHPPRYRNSPTMTAFFYGSTTAQERQTAEKIIAANSVNWSMSLAEIYFSEDASQCIQEIKGNLR